MTATGPPRVRNLRHGHDGTGIVVDRSSKWGNPFVMGRDGDRSAVIDKHAAWLLCSDEAAPLRRTIYELAGQDLWCWCAPAACHADLLLRLSNPDPG